MRVKESETAAEPSDCWSVDSLEPEQLQDEKEEEELLRVLPDLDCEKYCCGSGATRQEALNIFVAVFNALADVLPRELSSTFLADLVVDFGVVDEKAKAGFYTGIASLVGCIALAFASPFWVMVSQRVGRRPVLIVCQLCNLVVMIALGFSTSYPYFVALRFVNGLLVGLLPVAKIVLGEQSTNRKVVVCGFSLASTFAQTSYLVGSLVGGFFSRPTRQYRDWAIWARVPAIKTLLDTFPILLTCLICSLILFVSLLLNICLLKETNEEVLRAFRDVVEEGVDNNVAEVELGELSFDDEWREDESADLSPPRPVLPSEESTAEGDNGSRGRSTCCCRKVLASEVCKKEPIIMLVSYFIGSLGLVLIRKTLPLLYVLPIADGGFGMSNYEVGIVGWVGGAASVIVCLVVTPLTLNYCFNGVCYLRFAFLVFALPIIALPEVNYLLVNLSGTLGVALMWVVVLFASVHHAFTRTAISDVTILGNNSISNSSKGVFQSISNFLGFWGKGLGPYLGNSLISLGVLVNSFPVDIHLCLIVGNVALLIVTIMAWFLPQSLAVPKGAKATPVDSKRRK